jgi:hypothetical protein
LFFWGVFSAPPIPLKPLQTEQALKWGQGNFCFQSVLCKWAAVLRQPNCDNRKKEVRHCF